MRYIDADELLTRLPEDLPYKASVKRVLMQAPTADVVEVVRCADCVYWEGGYGYCNRVGVDCYGNSSFNKNSFCSCGKRRAEE